LGFFDTLTQSQAICSKEETTGHHAPLGELAGICLLLGWLLPFGRLISRRELHVFTHAPTFDSSEAVESPA